MAWEAHTSVEHYCEAWQANPRIIPKNLTLPSDDQSYFYLNISAVFQTYRIEEDEENDDVNETLEEDEEHEKGFLVPYDHLLQDQTSWSTLSDMLSQVHIPIEEQPSMLHRISHIARDISGNHGNLGSKILPMTVRIYVTIIEDESEEGVGGDIVTNARPKPARRESVELLESLKIEQSTTELCVICQDTMVVGSMARRMPCRHVYHADCIVNWLGVRNFCPLCRFELPS